MVSIHLIELIHFDNELCLMTLDIKCLEYTYCVFDHRFRDVAVPVF